MPALSPKKTKLKKWYLSTFFLNLILALVIFYNAELGRILGIKEPPLAISVVWPSTGFALAALLLFGTRVWPGIFIGNFAYNFLHLYLNQPLTQQTWPISFLAGAIIALGSLTQALVGNYIMRRFCTSGYFNTVRDIMIFLIPAGLLTCLIASIIGTLTLKFYSALSWNTAFYTWLTFWIGDTMGVYIFTPLIVIWSSRKSLVRLRDYKWEALSMVLALGLISLLTFTVDYPLVHLFVPFSVWVAYRFRMHGATLAIFCITIIVIVATSIGYGPFERIQVFNPLLMLVTFLEIIVATCLILAAVTNEREWASHQLQSYNIDLQEAVKVGREELKDLSSEVYVKEKIATLGLLTSGMVRHIQICLNRINSFTKVSLDLTSKLKNLFNTIKDTVPAELSSSFQNNFENISNSLNHIGKLETQLSKIARVIEEQAVLTTYGRVKIKSINVNLLLNKCLNEAKKESEKRYPDFVFTAHEEFDETIEMILVDPMSLAHAFFHLMNKSIHSMKIKKDQMGESYSPILKIHTENLNGQIKILMRDNGAGLSQAQLKDMLFSFVEERPEKDSSLPEEAPDLTFNLAYDIITHIYLGEVQVDTQEGEYLQFTILLPKDQS